ncbi:MAG: hypothetical protein V2I37_08690 [Marinilabiliaceae bacterium]|jgi:hypothetical protein|nr:hypothetical protein [Marinilabiliaceae bacterium]
MMKKLIKLSIFLVLLAGCSDIKKEDNSIDLSDAAEKSINTLRDKYPAENHDRISRGVKHLSELWFSSDGTAGDFSSFCEKYFIPSGPALEQAFNTLELQFEYIRGYSRELALQLDLPLVTHSRPVTEIDRLISASKPSSDYYASKLAFSIALNFPYYSYREKEEYGREWTREQWAMVRLGDMFRSRNNPSFKSESVPLPDELVDYTNLYILSMDHMLSPAMEVIFPEGTRLNCHNGLRDEVKGLYTRSNSLERQEMISRIVMHIIYQTIPLCMIGESEFFWEPVANRVFRKEGNEYIEIEAEAESGRRYRNLHFRMKEEMARDNSLADGTTYLSRTFESRQLSEERIVALLESVVSSPMKKEVAEILKDRLGRDLKPFDIWYPGFQSQSDYDMDKLDALLREKYPTPLAFQDDIPDILRRIGFDNETADFLGSHVVVDPVPSGGHANGAQMKGASAHLRTRFEPYGLNYKGYRIGMHEIGHTIEQNISLYKTDYYFLKGIPSSPFTEAMADLIAYRDVLGLGLSSEYTKKDRELNALAAFWFVCEMGAEALHEIRVWHWFYENPDATAEELGRATIDLANEVWNEYFADIFGISDVPVFSIYNHFINGALYLHSYPLGNIVLMQLEEFFEGKNFAEEMVRVCAIGNLTPDQWMIEATGEAFSSEPMLRAVRKAIDNYEAKQ